MEPFDHFWGDVGLSHRPRALGGGWHRGGGALHHMTQMLDALAADAGGALMQQRGELPADDREFLHGKAMQESAEGKAGEEAGEDGSGVVSQSYSYSSILRAGQPAVEKTVRKVVGADGRQRTVTRKRLGEQELVERQAAADSEVQRALAGGGSAGEAEVEQFEQAFEQARRGGRPAAADAAPRRQLELSVEQTEPPLPPSDSSMDSGRPGTPHPAKLEAEVGQSGRAQTDGGSGCRGSFGAPASAELAKQVALVKEVLPELEDSEISTLLAKHSGNVRAVLRDQLSRL